MMKMNTAFSFRGLHSVSMAIAVLALVLAPCAASAQTENPPPDDCTEIPPDEPPPGTNCYWMQVAIEENWQGEAVSNSSGPQVIVLHQDSLDYQCYAGEVPCQEYPSLDINYTDERKRTHRYQVGTTVSAGAATSLALKLVVDAKASVEVTAEYENEEEHTYTIELSFEQPFCSKWEYLDTIERWTASGHVTEADYRVTWCNSCLCGDLTYTYCGGNTATGTATGYTNRQRYFSWADDCDCWMECPE